MKVNTECAIPAFRADLQTKQAFRSRVLPLLCLTEATPTAGDTKQASLNADAFGMSDRSFDYPIL